MGAGQKVVSGVIWTIIFNFINAIYGFIAVPLLIQFYGKAEYGLIGLAMSVNVYMQLMDMGFNNTNIRFYSNWLAKGEYDNVKKGFQTSLCFYGFVGLINSIILLVISFYSNIIFNVTIEQGIVLKHLFYILAISAFFSWSTSCFDQLIKSTENVAWIQKMQIIAKFLMLGVIFLTISTRGTIEFYFLITSIASFSMFPFYIWKVKSLLPNVSFNPKINFHILREMFPYCMNIFSFAIFQFSFHNLRPVFLGIQGNVESIADFRILNGIVGIVTMIGGTFLGVLVPSTSKLVAEGNTQAFFRVAYEGTKYVSMIICLCCFGMMTIGPELLTIYVGNSYLYLIPWFNLWLICTLGTHNQAISSLILAGDDVRAISFITIISSLIGLFIAWHLIPYYGVGGVIVALAIYSIIQIVFFYVYYWPTVMEIDSFRVFRHSFSPFVVVGIIAYFIVRIDFFDFDSPFYMLVIKAFFFLFVYLLGVCIVIRRSGINAFFALIKKK